MMNYTSCAHRQQGDAPASIEEYLVSVIASGKHCDPLRRSADNDDWSDLSEDDIDDLRRLNEEAYSSNNVPNSASLQDPQALAAKAVEVAPADRRPVAANSPSKASRTRIKVSDKTKVLPSEVATGQTPEGNHPGPGNDNIQWKEANQFQKFHGALARAHELGGYAFSLKLSDNMIERIMRAVSRGESPARVMNKELDRYLRQVIPDCMLPYAFVFEAGPGIPLHLHGVVVLPAHDIQTLKAVRRALQLAGGKIGKWSKCRQSHTKRLYNGSGWFRYTQKSRRVTADILGSERLTFVSRPLQQQTRDGWGQSPARSRSASKPERCRKRRKVVLSSRTSPVTSSVPVAHSAAPRFS